MHVRDMLGILQAFAFLLFKYYAPKPSKTYFETLFTFKSLYESFFVFRGERCSCVPTCPLVTLDSEFWALGAEQRRRSQSAIIARDRWHGIRQWREHAHGTHSECCGILCLPGAFATAHMETHMGKHHQDPQTTLDFLGAMNYMSIQCFLQRQVWGVPEGSKSHEYMSPLKHITHLPVTENDWHWPAFISLQHKNSHRQCEDAWALGNPCWSKMCCRCLCFWKRHRFVSTPTMGETSVKLSKRNIMRDLGEKDETSRSWSINYNFSNPGWLVFSKQPEGWWQKVGEVET